MGSPQLEDFVYQDESLDADLLIQCSEWPTVYIRLGKPDNEKKIINVLLFKNQLGSQNEFCTNNGKYW